MRTFLPGWRVELPTDFIEVTGFDPLPLRVQINRFIFSEQPRGYVREAHLKLNDIVVARDSRGRGLGTRMVATVCQYADVQGLAVWLAVRGEGPDEEANTRRLIAWYQRFGFSELTKVDQKRYGIYEMLPALVRHAERHDGW